MTKPAAIERVLKLLRLAAPTSGTTDHERTSAALEAAKLIMEYDLTVVERPLPAPKERPQPPRDGDWMARARSASAAAAAARQAEESTRGFYADTRRRKKREPSFAASDWNEIRADRFTLCVACGNGIFEGERCWYSRSGFRHYSITCDSD